MIKKSICLKGVLILRRETKNYNASFCILNSTLDELEENFELLHPEEKIYYRNLIHSKRKLSYLLGRVGAKKAVAELIGENREPLLIDFGIFEFPVVKSAVNHNIQLSISHCGNIGIVLAFPEEHPLGIDIEQIQKRNTGTIHSQLTNSELSLLSEVEQHSSIVDMIFWTAKEAISKIFKTGLTAEFKIFEINSVKREGSIYLSTFTNFIQYKAVTFHSGDYICSIVMPKNSLVDLEKFSTSFVNVTL